MDVIDQALDNRLPVLQAAQTGANIIAELALDDRVDSFGFPALTEQAIQSSRSDQLSPGFAVGVNQVTAPTDRWDQIPSLNRLAVEARIG